MRLAPLLLTAALTGSAALAVEAPAGDDASVVLGAACGATCRCGATGVRTTLKRR
jgi:hypothetical protein